MPKDRGKWEKKWLNSWERQQRENLPEGVGLEYSPLLDIKERPWMLISHLLRYYFVSDRLIRYLEKGFNPGPLGILDIGCGYGEMVNFLNGIPLPAGYSRSYIGVDGDPNRILRAKIAFPKTQFLVITLPEGLEALADCYQGFICTEVFEHLSPSKGEQLLRTMANMSVPGAIAVFTVPAPEVGMRRKNPLHQKEYSPEDFIQAAEVNGWNVMDWFWLRVRATELPAKNSRIPYDLYHSLASPILQDPNVRGSDALYILQVA